jgi:hypothetical protein
MQYTDKEMEEAVAKGTWPPFKYMCLKCEVEIQSKWPGQYVECECGECFVDCTPHYVRLGGGKELLQVVD